MAKRLLIPALLLCSAAHATTPQQQFIEDWTAKGLSPDYLNQALAQAEKDPEVLAAISTPWEAKPWYQYRQLFLTQERLDDGLAFWKAHQDTLARAEQQYGVDAAMIVAIIGIETRYGQFTGRYPVLNALYTLGFYYPKRAKFFSSELGHYLKLAQQEGWSLSDIKGSYAGAMGWGQFIPSSYLAYAVDFDGDGKRDLLNNPVDAIGSVANYFAEHKWRLGAPVAQAVDTPSVSLSAPDSWQGKPLTTTVAQLKAKGVDVSGPESDTAAILMLQSAEDQQQAYQVSSNFYTITRYNRSPLYAMAAHEFSQRLHNGFYQ
ncbi:membrane-bound lytic murein transglycosylase B [Ferrimonas sediminum]|uniref:Membrane-bound lytic murein transglycosylase B n=1 Tax=Ferrimonas sediminum TaxID=718193 RepID=A0A1G8QM32_9GAMM|nr:lytic murein transglycosylase B [Ferrimonas sediminum]SDJ05425.1 membrane-bound lytic murein transglycosylase B [Ferrimonas sediminum]